MSGNSILILVYFIINVIVALVYALDKHKAIEGKWRIKEKTLLTLGFIGPFGAVAGMKLFHHKTQKPRFKMNYVFLVLHVLIIVFVICETI